MSRFLVVKNIVNLETRFLGLPAGSERITAMRLSKDRERLVVGFVADDPVLDISQHLFVLLRVPIVIFVPGERLPGRLRKPLIYELLDPVVLLDELLFLILVN
jgi:hypothetical protein